MNTIAIVIPYYKIDFFEETLKSVTSQTDKRFTLYIGNDASPDDPFPLIEKYFPDGNYHYFDYKENLGGKNLAMQWERILENVKEEWFQILGDDDVISENFVEEFYANLHETVQQKAMVLKAPQCIINEMGEVMAGLSEFPYLFSRNYNWQRKFRSGERASLSEHIFKTSQYRKYKFQKFPIAWGSDDVAVYEFSESEPILFLKKSKVFVRVSKHSISGSEDNIIAKKNAYHYFEKYMINHHYKNLEKEDIYKMINQQISYSYKNNLSLRINLYKIYWYFKDITQIKKSFKTYFYLNQMRKKQK
ncbi:glycosyltransferase family 2 protein [Kaistella haifensis]|nr:glycosyltransferase family 2 protein [Kaistella haifensis]